MPCGSLERAFDPGWVRAFRGNTHLLGARVATAEVASCGVALFHPAEGLLLGRVLRRFLIQ